MEGLEWRRPSDRTVAKFRDSLHRNGVRVTVRMEKGKDIDAACGQLRLKTKQKKTNYNCFVWFCVCKTPSTVTRICQT